VALGCDVEFLGRLDGPKEAGSDVGAAVEECQAKRLKPDAASQAAARIIAKLESGECW